MRYDDVYREAAPTSDSQGNAMYEGVIEGAGRVVGDLGVEDGASHSGHEVNNLFVNDRGEQFVDVTRTSGFDHRGDGRALAQWDYDLDGRVDLALLSANAPFLQVFHNESGAGASEGNGFVALRLHGGNESAEPAPGWSPRDACGARAIVRIGTRKIVRERLCGQGFASQHSATLLVGLGTSDRADSIEVRWPSGKRTVVGAVPAGSRVDLWERGPKKKRSRVERYEPMTPPVTERAATKAAQGPTVPFADLAQGDAPLQLYTSMATWCSSCLGELPWLRALRAEVPEERLGLVGLPVDASDTEEMLAQWREQYAPSYRLRTELVGERRSEVRAWLEEQAGAAALPTSVITDRAGQVLWVKAGRPTLSDVRRLLASTEGS